MDPNTLSVMQGAAGAGGDDKVYVEDVFSTDVWEGDGGGGQSITNGIDLDGEGGLVWSKNRDQSNVSHLLNDSEREISSGNFYDELASDSPAMNAAATPWGVYSFNSNGFSLGGNNAQFNFNGDDYVSWTFRKAPGFFDIVKWSGDNGGDRYINHDLGSIPGCVVVKRTDASMDWGVYHRELGTVQTDGLILNDTDKIGVSNINPIRTAPTSTQIHIRGGSNEYNDSPGTYIAYIFAHDAAQFGTNGNESIIKCGKYTGNGSTTDGKTIDLGFEPQWVLLKGSSDVTSWAIFDTMRGFDASGSGTYLRGDAQDNEASSSSNYLEVTSTGFKAVGSGGDYNYNGDDYIYIAIRRGPMKTPEDATEVFAMDTGSSANPGPTLDSGFPVDFAIQAEPASSSNDNWFVSRLTNQEYLIANTTHDGQGPYSYIEWDHMAGWGRTYSSTVQSWMFRRAPGFCDVVCYPGSGSFGVVDDRYHNLGVEPELIIIKTRDSNESWRIYAKPLGNTYSLLLPSDSGKEGPQNGWWASTTPDESKFSLGDDDGVNKNTDNYIAYLFASCPGVSKVGTYTGAGSGTDVNVNCGFSAGARFVMIKSFNTTGDWFLYDTLRGINIGNDPFGKLNSTGAFNDGVTNGEDRIDPYTSGFTVAGTDLTHNTLNDTYIYLAIA